MPSEVLKLRVPLIFCFPCSCYNLVMGANKSTLLLKRFLSYVIRRVLNNICSFDWKSFFLPLSLHRAFVFFAPRYRLLLMAQPLSSPSQSKTALLSFAINKHNKHSLPLMLYSESVHQLDGVDLHLKRTLLVFHLSFWLTWAN